MKTQAFEERPDRSTPPDELPGLDVPQAEFPVEQFAPRGRRLIAAASCQKFSIRRELEAQDRKLVLLEWLLFFARFGIPKRNLDTVVADRQMPVVRRERDRSARRIYR